jgi:hypothetical protein
VLLRKDQPLTRETLLEAVSLGHCYVSFDLFSAPTGFNFVVNRSEKMMGDEVPSASQPELLVTAPLTSRFVLFKNGSAAEEKTGTNAQFNVTTPGAYRVEVYLDSLPSPVKGQPWIISNPIYVR